jgi:hypothetical protein
MPSLPPLDGFDAPPCAGIRAGASTVSTDATLNSVVGPSLPFPTMGEHDAFGSSDVLGIEFPSPLHDQQEHGGDCTRARFYSLSCESLAPSPTSFGASTPTYSPHHHDEMEGGYSPMARTPTPFVGVTPSHHPTDIVDWAARTSADNVSEYAHVILPYWAKYAGEILASDDVAYGSPRKRTLCWEKNDGPPPSQSEVNRALYVHSGISRTHWVRSYLALAEH